ncbi:MAG: glycosyltransferase, partial [Lutibacter sp.]
MPKSNSNKVLKFSIVIPVYNRPQEIDELLESLTKQDYDNDFEVIVVEDGSEISCKSVVEKYNKDLNLKYFYKENTGAGLSRNFGMQQASGNYFVIFDSDCIIPNQYLSAVSEHLKTYFTDGFGGPDRAHVSFSNVQKAINYAMTSFFTTGGLRGNKKSLHKFQPRSFNMGISKQAFIKTGGFSKMKIGEDIDLSFRLWKNNFKTQFINEAYVYHKRRVNFLQFFKQVFAFGKKRPWLNNKYPNTSKISYWFPSIFVFIFLILPFSIFFKIGILTWVFGIYFILIFIDSLIKNKSLVVAFLSIWATVVQFFGYGIGFLLG